jgi:hypothetical protein
LSPEAECARAEDEARWRDQDERHFEAHYETALAGAKVEVSDVESDVRDLTEALAKTKELCSPTVARRTAALLETAKVQLVCARQVLAILERGAQDEAALVAAPKPSEADLAVAEERAAVVAWMKKYIAEFYENFGDADDCVTVSIRGWEEEIARGDHRKEEVRADEVLAILRQRGTTDEIKLLVDGGMRPLDARITAHVYKRMMEAAHEHSASAVAEERERVAAYLAAEGARYRSTLSGKCIHPQFANQCTVTAEVYEGAARDIRAGKHVEVKS